MAGTPTDRVFRDPLHDIIVVPAAERALLDLLETRSVQRLRRIRQLGLAHLVFPGAEHSRFIHSLGVLHVAGKMLDRLAGFARDDDAIAATLDKRREILVAALLHDVGHGPFSHTFEHVLGDVMGEHEAWSRRIVLDESSEVHRVLQRHDVDVAFVADLIAGDADDLLAQDIVSSQLDADRLDYLRRDSLMTGVAYGVIDLAWILNVLRPGRGRDGRLRLGIDVIKGLHAVESYLFARRSIHLQVYHHRTVRAMEAMLGNLLETARATVREGEALPVRTPPGVAALLGDTPPTTESFLDLDDSDIHVALKAWAADGASSARHDAMRRMARAILCRKCIYAHVDLSGADTRIARVEAAIADLDDEARLHVTLDDWQGTLYLSASAALAEGTEARAAFAKVIPTVDADGVVRPIEQDAPWLSMMQNFPGRQTRLYYDPAYGDALAAVLDAATR